MASTQRLSLTMVLALVGLLVSGWLDDAGAQQSPTLTNTVTIDGEPSERPITFVDEGIMFTSPLEGAELCRGQSLSWNGPTSGKYRVWLGTAVDGRDLLNTSTSTLSLAAPALPDDQTMYATLLYRPSGERSWIVADNRSFTPCANPIEFTPSIRSRRCSGEVITWTGPDSGRYRLRLDTYFDGKGIMNTSTPDRSVTVAPNLPSGIDIHATLRHRGESGVWRLVDSAIFRPCLNPIEIVSPTPNTPLCADDVIEWIGGGLGKYRVRVGTTPDGTDVLNIATYRSNYRVRSLPADVSGTLYMSLRYQRNRGGPWALHATTELTSCG